MLVVLVRVKMILVSKLNKQYMIGLTQEPFDTNGDRGMDRVKFRDAIASKNGIYKIRLTLSPPLNFIKNHRL